ncbi:MAG: rhombotarget lipoprotein [Gallionellales bacterium RIFCSPLOWO2_02_FULL_57_47]|nr:MAG: rhombotarget lipoprotein [Gallionellales bacterium RIFCSPLOWO2_02_FULL_57_47]OGT16694.1 MAG: rhombotarget lipoprotein [Gallionellales bacterium RIFCSPHIGHO2_02_FULL_57_16]
MKRTNGFLLIAFLVFLPIIALIGGCATGTTKHATSVVDYLFPDTKEPVVTPGIPVLTLPLRVGIAFVPSDSTKGGRGSQFRGGFPPFHGGALALTEKRKADLMQEVANHFKKYSFVKEIEIVPSAYLKPGGSFANLDQIRTMYGVDIIALLSYDQVQFTDQGKLSLTYWTIVGAYVIPGEKNDTHTMIDAVVYDITSRKMLFRAPGMSHIKGSATLVNLSEELRADSDKGFSDAAKEMIVNLDDQLAHFKEKVKERPAEYKVVRTPGYTGGGTGGGSIDPISLMLLVGFGGYFFWKQKRI